MIASRCYRFAGGPTTHALLAVVLLPAIFGACLGWIPLPEQIVRKGGRPANEPAGLPVRAGEAAGERGQSAPTTGLARKVVSSKEAPASLIADDGSRCAVSASRFEEMQVGDKVWCLWSGTTPRT
jgi:hypothetical protein